MAAGWRRYVAQAAGITLLADSGDFGVIVGGANPWRLLEVRVFQRGTPTIVMDTVLLHRGTVTATGGTVTPYQYSTGSPAPTAVVRSLPTTDVTSDTWQFRMGWNLLQECHFLPTPELWVPVVPSAGIGITRGTTTAHTNVGFTVVWEEFAGT